MSIVIKNKNYFLKRRKDLIDGAICHTIIYENSSSKDFNTFKMNYRETVNYIMYMKEQQEKKD